MSTDVGHDQRPAAVRSFVDVDKITTEVLDGEILFKSRFVEHGSGSTLAALVSPNMRAVTVRVDDVIGVAGFLLPGNYVDVLARAWSDAPRTRKPKPFCAT